MNETIKRYPVNYLCDLMYGVEPMDHDVAALVRHLRVDRKLSYREVGRALCDAEQDPAVCFQIGQALSQQAAGFLGERPDAGWL